MIFEYRESLTPQECEELIQLGKDRLTPAFTLGVNREGYRTALNCWITEPLPITAKVKLLVKQATGVPVENQEHVHIVKYEVGGEYKPHHDFFHPNTDYFESQVARGGQRTHSCLFYLNTDFTGGETEFPNLGVKITPELGKLIVWDNLNNGQLDYDSLHAGLPVASGEKWICVVWVRENEFR